MNKICLRLLTRWDFLIRLAQLTSFHHLPQVTCEYRHFRGSRHHVLAGDDNARSGAVDQFLLMKAKVLDKHAALLTAELLARGIAKMRRELVELGEETSSTRRTNVTRERSYRLLEDRFHSLNGEVTALRTDRERADNELQRLYDEEKALRGATEEQTAHLQRTYAEIERLNGLIRDIESSRAWRLHQYIQRVRRRGS